MLVLLRNIVKFKLYEFVFKCTDGLQLRFCFAQELFEFDIIVLCKCLPIMFIRTARMCCYCQRLAFSNCMSGQFTLSCFVQECLFSELWERYIYICCVASCIITVCSKIAPGSVCVSWCDMLHLHSLFQIILCY